jgi:hypothetical protein
LKTGDGNDSLATNWVARKSIEVRAVSDPFGKELTMAAFDRLFQKPKISLVRLLLIVV